MTLHCLRLLPRLGKGDSLGSSTETLAQVTITVTTEPLCRITAPPLVIPLVHRARSERRHPNMYQNDIELEAALMPKLVVSK